MRLSHLFVKEDSFVICLPDPFTQCCVLAFTITSCPREDFSLLPFLHFFMALSTSWSDESLDSSSLARFRLALWADSVEPPVEVEPPLLFILTIRFF